MPTTTHLRLRRAHGVYRYGDEVSHLFGCFDKVGATCRGPGSTVPEHLANQRQILARHDSLDGNGVSKVMQAKLAEIRVRANRPPAVRQNPDASVAGPTCSSGTKALMEGDFESLGKTIGAYFELRKKLKELVLDKPTIVAFDPKYPTSCSPSPSHARGQPIAEPAYTVKRARINDVRRAGGEPHTPAKNIRTQSEFGYLGSYPLFPS